MAAASAALNGSMVFASAENGAIILSESDAHQTPTAQNGKPPKVLEKVEEESAENESCPTPRLWHNPRWLLACLSLAAIVQGMIFTNVVISSIERR